MDHFFIEKQNILFSHIDHLLTRKERIFLAIDGPCTAGKTTLANILYKKYGCTVFHMDDFFLRPAQRTPDRLAEPGGNVDYERFWEEVMLPLQAGKDFAYRPYSCASQALKDPVAVSPAPLTVIEGTYSLHPYFGNPYDLRIFLSVDPETQRQRIGLRESWKQERFFREWIPMEQHYFDSFSIRESCDLIL